MTTLLLDAFGFAADLHGAQVRKGRPIPYIAHLMSVAALVLEDGGSEAEAVAALLHDSIEDAGPDYPGGSDLLREAIRRRFGREVLDIIEGCTDAETRPKPPWRPRKEGFVARIADATPSVRRVVAADKLHNARSLLEEYRTEGEALWQCFSGGREGTLWYYRAVQSGLVAAGEETANLRELDRVLRELESLVAEDQK